MPGTVAPTVTGTVERYLLNPHGEEDGLLLSDGTVVKFPPHLGTAIMSAAPPGDEVRVAGFFGPATQQGRAVRALSIQSTRSGQTVVVEPPATPPVPPELRGLTLVRLTVSGTVTRFLVNDRGDVDGLLLSGGEQVKFEPREGALVAMVLDRHAGQRAQVSGFGTQNGFGTVVDATSLTLAGQTVPLDSRPGGTPPPPPLAPR